jgi:hypothetical protein
MMTAPLRFVLPVLLVAAASATAQTMDDDIRAARQRVAAIDDGGDDACSPEREHVHAQLERLDKLAPKMHLQYRTREERDGVLADYSRTLESVDSAVKSLAYCREVVRKENRMMLGIGGGVVAAGGIAAVVLIRKRKRKRSR